jgi:acyl-coenzyme A synthetase/AMP-(fatty) acid ligase
MPGVVARIIKPDGSFGRVGERGELMVKSPSNAINIGYIGAPEASALCQSLPRICN